ncbi:hypothetical protein Tco_1267095, partial [Tanacetum coccineum]
MVKESLKDVVLAKESSQPQSSYEAAATLIEFELKKILIDKMDKSKSYLAAPEHRECYEGLKKSYDLDKTISLLTEPEFEVADSDMPQDQEENLEPTNPDWNIDKTPQQGQNQSWLMTLALSAKKPSKTFDELMSTPIDFSVFIMNGLKINNLTQETLLGPAFRLLKGTRSNYAELEYDFEECYKALSEKRDWEIQKAVPIKVAYDKHALRGISHWREQRKTFYGYARGLQSRHDVYSKKHILAVTQVGVMRKHGYGYLKEIVNWLTNLSGDDVSNFAIALRMFTRSLVIQNRVKDLQLGVKSYQNKINVTKP